jgi:hypothetical protein
METLEKEEIDRPVVDSWRRAPSREQTAYAIDLCRSELPYAERVRTIATLRMLDSRAMSELIDDLKEVRRRRLERLRRQRRRPRRR